MDNKNLYEILGLKENASKEEIKISFRKLVRIYHPDINPTKEAEVYFKLLNNAVDTLLDDVKRSQYDVLMGIRKRESYTKPNANSEFKPFNTKNETGAVKEPFRNSFYRKEKSFKRAPIDENSSSGGNFEEKSFVGAGGNFKKGKDIVTVVQISECEASKGTTRKINILHSEKCPKCLGRKFINGSKCALCKGIGENSSHKKVGVKIPKGVKTGTKIKLEGMGELGKCNEINGDLYLLIEIEPDKKERFEGKNIVTEVSITPYQAVLGTILKISTQAGVVSVKIPPLTKSMTRFKLKTDDRFDKSLTNLQSDYIVVVKIDIPDDLSEEAVNLYKKLEKLSEEKSLRKSGESF